MIALVTGQPGAGKSYYSVRKIVTALEAGKSVVTNVALEDGWALKAARSNLTTRLIPGRSAAKAARYERMTFVSEDLDELFAVRLAGKGEGRGTMVLDEAHNWLNSRTWDADDTGQKLTKAEAVQARLKIVRFFSQHRKLGYDVFLITQDALNLDRQVRSLFEYHVKLKNLRNFKVGGIPVMPCNLFLALWFWNDGAKTIVKRECYRLNMGVANLYDTYALSHGMEDVDEQALVLPRPPPPRPIKRPKTAPASS